MHCIPLNLAKQAAKLVPEYVEEMFDKAPLSLLGKRAQESKIINNSFKRCGKSGKQWKLDFSKPMFKEEHARWEKNWSKEGDRGLPKMMFEAKYGGRENVLEMLKAGQVSEMMVNGVAMIYWQEAEAMHMSGKTDSIGVSQVICVCSS